MQAWSYGWRNGVLRPDYQALATRSNIIDQFKAYGWGDMAQGLEKTYNADLANYMKMVSADVWNNRNNKEQFLSYDPQRNSGRPIGGDRIGRVAGADKRAAQQAKIEALGKQGQADEQYAAQQQLKAKQQLIQDEESAETSRLINKNLADWLAVYNPSYGGQ